MVTKQGLNAHLAEYNDDEDEKTDEDEDHTIVWQNIIFLPFQPVFKLIVLCAVLIKTVMGPLQSVYPVTYCNNVMDADFYLYLIKNAYMHICDVIYAIDTFFHIIHMQVTDVAMSREFLPKSKFLILIDLISLVPFFRLLTTDNCSPIQVWPNILGFVEFITVYRIGEYFTITTTHEFWKIIIGFLLIFIVTINCITWLFMLLTMNVTTFTCTNCTYYEVYDWRLTVTEKLSETHLGTFVSSASFVLSFLLTRLFDETDPSTIFEYIFACILMIFGYLVTTFILFPKAFGESLLQLRRVCELLPRMHRIIDETKRKNPCAKAHIDVSNFYSLIWKKREGITNIPQVISELPRYLRLEIRMDLLWPVFYHSPTFRRVSTPFQRWFSDMAHLDYKLPNENFFAGPHSRTHYFYLKSGIVQLISAEDGITPLVSVSGGTIFGDVNFFVPPNSKNVIVRCLTYCEVVFFSRHDIIQALHKFPEDRRNIMIRVKERIKHAHTLHSCKQHVRGLDRAEDEGVAWLKKRWWELNAVVTNWKNKSLKADIHCDLPPEDAIYHCSKYIGRLVLCPDEHLKRTSMFANYQFPWILLPNSTIVLVWQRIVICTVFLVLFMHPPNIAKSVKPKYFQYVQAWTDFIYITDIFVLLLTSIETQEHLVSDFASVMLIHCKSSYFILTLLATIWIEDFVVIIGKPELYSICQFNRLIKIHVLFSNKHTNKNIKRDPFFEVCYRIVLLHVCFEYISGYLIYVISKIVPDITKDYFFGHYRLCDTEDNTFHIAVAWIFRYLYSDYMPQTQTDIYLAVGVQLILFIIHMYCSTSLIAVMYLKYKDTADFLFFVSNITKHYKEYHIHPDLLIRLNRYLLSHWKFYKGVTVTNPDQLKEEPYDIYWKAHGEIAMGVLNESQVFVGADQSLVRELAYHCKFTILPRDATLLLTGVTSKNVSWLFNGVIKIEYCDESGPVIKEVDKRGVMLAFSCVFFEYESLVTATALTDCELLYIGRKDFFHILNCYPTEKAHVETCRRKFKEPFKDIVSVHVKRYRNQKRKIQLLREIEESKLKKHQKMKPLIEPPRYKWKNPESKFIKYWMPLRTFFVGVAIIAAALEGGCGYNSRILITIVAEICDWFARIDMILMCLIGYYDHRGIVIYSKCKCIKRYLCRGFILDVIASFPWYRAIQYIPSTQIEEDTALVINTVCKFARVHLLLGYFNYLANSPMVSVALISILKWQIFLILLVVSVSQYLIYKCVKFEWDDSMELVNCTKRDKCWLPVHIKLTETPTAHEMRLLFGESLVLAQGALMRINMGMFKVDRHDFSLEFVLFCIGLIYWGISCYVLSALTLSTRGNTLFQHAVTSLSKFLHAERVEDELIQRSLGHFSYWWKRTKNINIQNIITKRIGIIFRQDLNYFFFKQTFMGLDSIINGGEQIQRQLACIGVQLYFLPGWTVMRELDLNPWVFVVHRGEVEITQEGKTLAILTKGSIFGQLYGTDHRPIHVSAHTVDHVDLLQIPVKAFQDNINDMVRYNISRNPQSDMDFLQVKKPFKENPYNTVAYLLRGRKTIKLPWSSEPIEAHSNTWYKRWLFLVWVVEPVVSVSIAMLLKTLPRDIKYTLIWVLCGLDVLHVVQFISEYFTMRLEVVDNRCVNKQVKLKMFKDPRTYLDAMTFIMPLLSFPTGNASYHHFRMLRLRHLYDFHQQFCQNFKSVIIPGLMNVAHICLLLHMVTCYWISISCRPSSRDSAFYIPDVPEPNIQNQSFFFEEWENPAIRGEGCPRASKICTKFGSNHTHFFHYLVPRRWQDDYIIALTFVVLHLTQTDMNNIAALTLNQIYYKLVIAFILNLLHIFIVSLALKVIYLAYRELYNYDYNVGNLFEYLKHIGLTSSVLECVKEYTNLLWQKQRGNWLPELAQQAPLCLREDLLGSLYAHHLQTLPLFRNLPAYFTRQLSARLQRVVIFSGKMVVQEGDIFACTYFIHEGEVEKWYTDSSGEKKMVTLLTTNGFFGLIPGLFPDSPHLFTYITRTVVDMVFLRFRDWQDLLEGYPDIKRDLYAAARQLKSDLGKT